LSVTCDRSVVFSGTPVSSSDCHDITEILLKVTLGTIKQTRLWHFKSCFSIKTIGFPLLETWVINTAIHISVIVEVSLPGWGNLSTRNKVLICGYLLTHVMVQLHRCHMWSNNCLPFRSTYIHPRFLVGFVCLIFSFCVVFCRTLFVLFLFAIVFYVISWFTPSDYLLVKQQY
jgi:hypothetical protein